MAGRFAAGFFWCPIVIVESSFRPAPWLRGPHRQTVFASKFRPSPSVAVDSERMELPDGDFLDLAWLPDANQPADTPLVVLLHGLTGSIESKYIRGLLQQTAARGWRGLLMHFRGAGPEPNRLARSYHSGDTDDFRVLIHRLHARFPDAQLAAVGYSLGGNVLLKYLGEEAGHTPLTTGVAVSVPFDLAVCARSINQGLSRAYQRYLIGNMRTEFKRKFTDKEPPFPIANLQQLQTFPAFDDAITAPLNGFNDSADYYARASSGPFLKNIKTPTLVLHSIDDPFMAPAMIPDDNMLSKSVQLELSRHGGHVGFVAADRWYQPTYWLEQRIPAWLEKSFV